MHIATATALLADSLTSDEARCDLSDLAVNTLRDEFGTDALAIVQEEFARINREGITTLKGYLHCRRAGSSFRINRAQRVAIFCHFATRNAR